MSLSGLRSIAVLVVAAFWVGLGFPAHAQAPADNKTADQQKAEAAKTEAAHIADAARQVAGPAGFPECVHAGELTITLWMNNDMDTAARHLTVYDRFGCPGAHLRASFRCLLRFGRPGPKDKDSLDSIVRTCWLDPSRMPTAAAAPTTAAAAPPANPAATAGTGAR